MRTRFPIVSRAKPTTEGAGADMRSMTGYGRCSLQADGREMTVEVKAVNHRFLDIGLRFPRSLGFLEDVARRVLADMLARGHVEVSLSYRNMRQDARRVDFDEPLLAAYMSAFDDARERHALRNDKSISLLPLLPDVLRVVEIEEDRDAVRDLFERCLRGAASGLIEMRQREGDALRADLQARLERLESLRKRVEAVAPDMVANYRERLQARMAELLGDAAPDEARMAQEVALFADRSAIDEELTRLGSHIAQAHAALEADEAVGRKLDFLVQELNREANTIGSKAASLPIVDCVVDMKCEMEKIREQVQNIE